MMIDSYDFGRITINGKRYNTDLLVFFLTKSRLVGGGKKCIVSK
jgi:hypothetical protein